MAAVTFTIADDGGVVTQGISTGSNSALCFEGLDEGTYTVAQVVPRTLELTTAPTIDINVTEGETVGLEFGSRIRPAATATQAVSEAPPTSDAPQPTAAVVTIDEPADDDGGPDLLALSGLGVMLVAVLLLAVLIILLLRQQRR
jgi:hypothetical protein